MSQLCTDVLLMCQTCSADCCQSWPQHATGLCFIQMSKLAATRNWILFYSDVKFGRNKQPDCVLFRYQIPLASDVSLVGAYSRVVFRWSVAKHWTVRWTVCDCRFPVQIFQFRSLLSSICLQNVKCSWWLDCRSSGRRGGVASGTLQKRTSSKGGYTLVTLPRIVTPYRDSVDWTRGRVTYQKLVTR